MLTKDELDLIRRALDSHRLMCVKTIDEYKRTIGKNHPSYRELTRECYVDINEADDLLEKVSALSLEDIPEENDVFRGKRITG